MSGGDSDNTLGIKAIKQHGGITMAQTADGTAPGNPEMPNNAIAGGFVNSSGAPKRGRRAAEPLGRVAADAPALLHPGYIAVGLGADHPTLTRIAIDISERRRTAAIIAHRRAW